MPAGQAARTVILARGGAITRPAAAIERAVPSAERLARSTEMVRLGSWIGSVRPSQGFRPLGLPSGLGPPDCPDTSLQYHSRHWITSFQKIADKQKVTQISCLSKEITQRVESIFRQVGGMAQAQQPPLQASQASRRRPARPKAEPPAPGRRAAEVRPPS